MNNYKNMANNVVSTTTMAVAPYIKMPLSSGHQWTSTQQLTVVCVIDTQLGDHLKDRECALEEIQQAVLSVGANFKRVQVSEIFGEQENYCLKSCLPTQLRIKKCT